MSESSIGVSFDFLKSDGAKAEVLTSTPIVEETKPATTKRKRKPKTTTDVIVAEDDTSLAEERKPENIGTYLETYNDTSNMINQTISDINYLSKQLNDDLQTVRNSRTIKGKYNYICNMNASLSNLISTKIQAIKEQNNTIRNANQMDYTRMKDAKASETMNDDKAIMDMYNSFISAPVGQSYNVPSSMNMTIAGTPTIIANDAVPGMEDVGYSNYVNNMTPAQNMMRLEGDPDIQNVVVWDQATGQKYFQVYNLRTHEPVPNTTPRDQMFMEDTTIDERHMIAKNINLNETYPLVIVNQNNDFSEY